MLCNAISEASPKNATAFICMDENHFLILPLLSKDLDKTGGERGIQQDEVPWRKKIRVEVREAEEVEEEEGEYREVLTQKILLE